MALCFLLTFQFIVYRNREGVRFLSEYPLRISGAAFSADISFYRVKFWLADEGKRRIVRTSDLCSVRIQPNGYTKLILQLRKDLLIPTSHTEAVQLVKALNALLSEWSAVEQRREQAARGRRPTGYT